MSTLAERLVLARTRPELGYSQEQLARMAGVSTSTIGNVEAGIRGMPRKIHKIASALGVRLEWLRDGTEPMIGDTDDWDTVKAWDQKTSAGSGVAIGTHLKAKPIKFRTDSLRAKRLDSEQLSVWVVDGDSMLPTYSNGTSVMFNESDTRIKSGKTYVIRWKEETYVKRLFQYDGRTWISSDNKADPQWAKDLPVHEDDDFKVLGRVAWSARWED